MKLTFPEMTFVIDTSPGAVSLVIENQDFLLQLLSDINTQVEGNDGYVVLSKGDKILSFSKNAEIITSFVPFDINRKQLLTKLSAALASVAVDEKYYSESLEILSGIEHFIYDIALECAGSIELKSCNIEAIIKAVSPRFEKSYDCLTEAIIDYIELVQYYDKPKLFVLINLRSFVSDGDCEKFIDTVNLRSYDILMIESSEHSLLKNEHRFIIDKDLCEIK